MSGPEDPSRGSGPRPAEPLVEVVLALAAIGLGVVRPIVQGSGAVGVVATFVAGVVLVAACGLLPRARCVPAAVLVAVAGIVVLALGDAAGSAYGTWALACVSGGVLALRVADSDRVRRRSRRPAR